MVDLPQMTVAQLIAELGKVDDKAKPVQVWLPGSRIALHQVMHNVTRYGVLLIEGNVEEGSALSMGR